MKEKTPYPVSFLIPVVLFLVGAVPLIIAAAPIVFVNSQWGRLGFIALAPVTFCFSYLLICCAVGSVFKKAIVPGKFPRDITHFVYGPRRMYGLAWGALFYCTPLYFAVLSVPALRKIMLRGFGYQGDLDVNIAPDAWIRDLPVLKLGKGVYVANRASIGTNMCLADGSILVDQISLGERTMVGHLAKLGPGVNAGKDVEIGVDAIIGIRVKLGDSAKISPQASVNHGAIVKEGAFIGATAYVGLKATVPAGMRVPTGACIPDGTILKDADDLNRILQSETEVIRKELAELRSVYSARSGLSAAAG